MTEDPSRRSMLRLLGAGTVVAATVQPGTASAQQVAAGARNRAELARLAPVAGDPVFVDEGERRGWWRWEDGDQSAAVRADPLQGLTVAHGALPATRGAWRRVWDGSTAQPEWFGARADAPDHDSAAAIQAALDLCAVVALGPGSYFVGRGLHIVRNGSSLIGTGLSQTDQGPNGNATRIVCTDPRDTIVQIGVDLPTPPRALVEAVHLAGFTVDRSVAPYTPASGPLGAIGIALRWCVNCHAERVVSLNSARGWSFAGTVENYVRFCAALRGREGSNPANDSFVGFHVDQNVASGYNGGNASLYLLYCRAFPGLVGRSPSLTYSAGVRFDGGWVDCFIHGFEAGGGIQYGIHAIGDGAASTSFRTENLMVTDSILDPGTVACVALEQAGPSSAVTLANNYFGTLDGVGVAISDVAGSVTLDHNQFIVGKAGGTGLRATRVNGLRSNGNILTGHRQPVVLADCTHFHLADTINGRFAPGASPAILLTRAVRGVLDCTVAGAAGSFTAAVELAGSDNRLVEVRCTGLDPAATRAGPRGALVHDGAPVDRAGEFGSRCLASGLLG